MIANTDNPIRDQYDYIDREAPRDQYRYNHCKSFHSMYPNTTCYTHLQVGVCHCAPKKRKKKKNQYKMSHHNSILYKRALHRHKDIPS